MDNKKNKTVAVRVGVGFMEDLRVIREYLEDVYTGIGFGSELSDSDIIRNCVMKRANEIREMRSKMSEN